MGKELGSLVIITIILSRVVEHVAVYEPGDYHPINYYEPHDIVIVTTAVEVSDDVDLEQIGK